MTSGILRPVALCKGVIYLASMEFIATRFGREGLAHVMGEVSAEDAEILRAVVAAGWYPIEPLLHMRRQMDRMYGQGDLAMVRDLGRFSGDWQMHSVLKPFLRLTSPHWLVERGIRVWRQYHDSGSWEFLRVEPKLLRARVSEFIADEAWCVGFCGFLERAVELTGGKEARCKHPRCRGRGDTVCEFEGSWL
jgi:hypothetical protein